MFSSQVYPEIYFIHTSDQIRSSSSYLFLIQKQFARLQMKYTNLITHVIYLSQIIITTQKKKDSTHQIVCVKYQTQNNNVG